MNVALLKQLGCVYVAGPARRWAGFGRLVAKDDDLPASPQLLLNQGQHACVEPSQAVSVGLVGPVASQHEPPGCTTWARPRDGRLGASGQH